MTNYREILRHHRLGLNKTEIATSCQCARTAMVAMLQREGELWLAIVAIK